MHQLTPAGLQIRPLPAGAQVRLRSMARGWGWGEAWFRAPCTQPRPRDGVRHLHVVCLRRACHPKWSLWGRPGRRGRLLGVRSVPPPQPSFPALKSTLCIRGGGSRPSRPEPVIARGSGAGGPVAPSGGEWRRSAPFVAGAEPSGLRWAGDGTPRPPLGAPGLERTSPSTGALELSRAREARSARDLGWFPRKGLGSPCLGPAPGLPCWEGLRPGEGRGSQACLILHGRALTASVPASLPSQPHFLWHLLWGMSRRDL